MDNYLEIMADILEVDEVNASDVLVEFESWDSLTQLSIIALVDETYGVTISAMELRNSKTIEDVYNLINGKKNV